MLCWQRSPAPLVSPFRMVERRAVEECVPLPLHLRAPSWPCSRGARLSRERGQATRMEPRGLVQVEVRVGLRLGLRWRLDVDAGLRVGGGGIRGPQLVRAPHRPAAFLVPSYSASCWLPAHPSSAFGWELSLPLAGLAPHYLSACWRGFLVSGLERRREG